MIFSQVTLPVNSPPANGILVAILLVTVVEKLASSPIAAANSLRVLRALGDESTKFDIAVSVYAVVATFVEASPADCVVAVTPLSITPFEVVNASSFAWSESVNTLLSLAAATAALISALL